MSDELKIDGIYTVSSDPWKVVAAARDAEARGYDGALSPEAAHDPFFPVLLAAQETERIDLGTGIAVAFARSPMTMAHSAHDLQLFSEGRFMLGLGSQVKAHITRRFSMPWSKPAARMREYVLALGAIWDCWNNGTKLRFEGEFYSHTLMTPMFSPRPSPHGPPRVFVAAVGPKMTEAAADVADGISVHPFTTRRYLTEVTLPRVTAKLDETGRDRSAFEVSLPILVATGADDEEMEAALAGIRQTIAFYGSTPTYRPVLEIHGFEGKGERLSTLVRQEAWDEIAEVVDDEMVDTFAVVAEPSKVAAAIAERFGGLLDRASFYVPYRIDQDLFADVREGLRGVKRAGAL